MRLQAIINRFLQSNMFLRILIVILLVVISFGVGIHFIEPEVYPTIFDGIWWVFVTASTVGYGDYVPNSIIGRTVAIILILLGGGFVSFFMVTLATTVFQIFNALKEGSAAYKGEEHFIVIGWNSRAKTTIQQLLIVNPSLQIVLIDETLTENPLHIRSIHFIRGNPTNDETLKQANVEKAGTVLITADQNRNEHEADMQSILILLAIKGLNPRIYCLVEVLTQEQINNAKRAGANEIIETFLLSSYVMINSIVSPGLSSTVKTLLNQIDGSKLELLQTSNMHITSTFTTCLQQLLEQNLLLIGIKRGEETLIFPSPSFVINENDYFIVISH